MIPEIRSATREVIGKYLPEELYSSKRDSIQTEIFNLAATRIKEKFIELDAVLIRDVGLPDKLKQAIERKLEQEQVALEYEFRLTRAEKEAERQRIEVRQGDGSGGGVHLGAEVVIGLAKRHSGAGQGGRAGHRDLSALRHVRPRL